MDTMSLLARTQTLPRVHVVLTIVAERPVIHGNPHRRRLTDRHDAEQTPKGQDNGSARTLAVGLETVQARSRLRHPQHGQWLESVAALGQQPAAKMQDVHRDA